MNPTPITSIMGFGRTNALPSGAEGVVEVGLLLPTKRAAALLQLAQDRHESVGQLLRKLIEKELAEIT